jgi:AcrR family transcriptional regulator
VATGKKVPKKAAPKRSRTTTPARPAGEPAHARLRANLPKQARSRLTLHRLLSAAEALLAHGGLDAATVPAIASAAGVSVGVVYRRFPDKDNLLRAVYERFFERLCEQNATQLQQLGLFTMPLPDLGRAVITGMVEGYRRNRGILRALHRYARTHPDPAFRRNARKANRMTINMLAAIFIAHRAEIDHPNPEAAVEFALLSVAAVLHTVVLEEDALHDFRTPQHLDEELTRLFFRYLGVRETKR